MEVTNHVGSPGDSHYPSCPHADTCPHCGAPKARQPFYPWVQPLPYYPSWPSWWGTTSAPFTWTTTTTQPAGS